MNVLMRRAPILSISNIRMVGRYHSLTQSTISPYPRFRTLPRVYAQTIDLGGRGNPPLPPSKPLATNNEEDNNKSKSNVLPVWAIPILGWILENCQTALSLIVLVVGGIFTLISFFKLVLGIDTIEKSIDKLDIKIDKIDTKLDTKIDKLDLKLDTKIDKISSELRSEMKEGFNKIDNKLNIIFLAAFGVSILAWNKK